MSARPLIGVTCGTFGSQPAKYGQNQAYVRAVDEAGGIPILVPPLSEEAALALFGRLDGLLFTGGPDLDPGHYGQAPDGSEEPDRDRDATELVLARAAATARLPVLGVCRGQQLLNVAFNGTLIQDLGGHDQKATGHAREEITHPMRITAESALARIAGGQSEVPVNSLHHQVVDRVGDGLRVTALSPDGHVEALESDDGLIVAVQCHPEHLTRLDWARNLFADLVARSANRSRTSAQRR